MLDVEAKIQTRSEDTDDLPAPAESVGQLDTSATAQQPQPSLANVAALVNYLSSTDSSIREVAERALIRLGPSMFRTLRHIINDTEEPPGLELRRRIERIARRIVNQRNRGILHSENPLPVVRDGLGRITGITLPNGRVFIEYASQPIPSRMDPIQFLHLVYDKRVVGGQVTIYALRPDGTYDTLSDGTRQMGFNWVRIDPRAKCGFRVGNF